MDLVIENGSIALGAYLRRPQNPTGLAGNLLLVCHGLPAGPAADGLAVMAYPEMVDRLAEESGWSVMGFLFRGAGGTAGQFSPGWWCEDLAAVVNFSRGQLGAAKVYVAGFGFGGAVAICTAGENESIAGVAAFGTAADMDGDANDPVGLAERARSLGLIEGPAGPEVTERWSAELRRLRPIDWVSRIPPRPLLIVHGSEDETVSATDARALADAAEDRAELRILPGAGHRLRHDPRTLAILIGWMGRQGAYGDSVSTGP